jgi:hypothetical protein
MKTLLTVLLMAWLIAGCATLALAHPENTLYCKLAKQAVMVSEEVLPNGLYVERYDTNKDGKPDIVTLSTVTSTKIHAEKNGGDTVEVVHAEHPTFYLVDKDFDDVPDVVLIDKGAGGKCADIVLYHDLRRPQTPNDDRAKMSGENL